MGLFSDNHSHWHDDSVHVNYPNQVNVHEHKAPTDESIRLMEEMHDKVLKNIIQKVHVENNRISGKVYLVDSPNYIDALTIIYIFKINDHDFRVEKKIKRDELFENGREIDDLVPLLKGKAEAVMLYYTLKIFCTVAYEQITGRPFDTKLLNNL